MFNVYLWILDVFSDPRVVKPQMLKPKIMWAACMMFSSNSYLNKSMLQNLTFYTNEFNFEFLEEQFIRTTKCVTDLDLQNEMIIFGSIPTDF